jgi:hypothetical protein
LKSQVIVLVGLDQRRFVALFVIPIPGGDHP